MNSSQFKELYEKGIITTEMPELWLPKQFQNGKWQNHYIGVNDQPLFLQKGWMINRDTNELRKFTLDTNKKANMNKTRDIHIKKLKQYALMLDAGISNGSVLEKDIDSAQNYLNKVADHLMERRYEIKDAYIVWELQALIDWINQEKDEADSLVETAIDVKGNRELYTENGRELADGLRIYEKGLKLHSKLYLLAFTFFFLFTVYYFVNVKIGLLALAMFVSLGWAIVEHIRHYFKKNHKNV